MIFTLDQNQAMAKACHPYLRKYYLFISHGINKCNAKNPISTRIAEMRITEE